MITIHLLCTQQYLVRDVINYIISGRLANLQLALSALCKQIGLWKLNQSFDKHIYFQPDPCLEIQPKLRAINTP